MGSPKALLPWGGTSLLRHAAGRLSAAGLPPLCAGPRALAAAEGMAHVEDAPAGAGPLGGIAGALELCDAFVLAVDMPLLEAEEIRRILDAAQGGRQAVVPCIAGRWQPLAAYWPRSLRAPLRGYLAAGGRSVLGFLRQQPATVLDEAALRALEVVPGHLRGFNTPEEYEALRLEAGT